MLHHVHAQHVLRLQAGAQSHVPKLQFTAGNRHQHRRSCCRPSSAPCSQHDLSQNWQNTLKGAASTFVALSVFVGMSDPATAAMEKRRPPPSTDANRCTLQALDSFADTRAKFSQEASAGNMVEAVVDARGCDFSNKDLRGKVLSGVLLEGANLQGSNLAGIQMARAQAQGADLSNVDLTDTNCYSTSFDGANLENAQFENSVLTGATFGKDRAGNWANLKNAHFEGALISSSDINRMCENPTLEVTTKKYELGCRGSK